jgi:hypothetical protein
MDSLNRTAVQATLHCLTGCAIGEILGMVIGGLAGWSNVATVVASIVLAFLFGYALTIGPLLRGGFPLRRALGLAFAADTASIAVMEVVDNAFMLVVPGAMDAHPTTMLFWGSLVASLVLAGVLAFPANRWLIAKGKGHAVVHATHGHGGPTVGEHPHSQDPHM